MYERVIIICGMPRSGTSWLGQVFDSSPEVAYRMEPLFSYSFKNIINITSSAEEIENFLDGVYRTNDEFIHQKENRYKGIYPEFNKNEKAGILVFKTTRHHELLRKYIEAVDNLQIVSIVRHPCAVINSWIHSYNEFEKKGCSIAKDWKTGACRKGEVGEYWGFNDWLSVTNGHVELSNEYSNFNILKYTDLVQTPEDTVKILFRNLSIQYVEQTAGFLEVCHSTHNDNPYSVFKSKSVETKWKAELDVRIQQEIINCTTAANLDQFLQ